MSRKPYFGAIFGFFFFSIFSAIFYHFLGEAKANIFSLFFPISGRRPETPVLAGGQGRKSCKAKSNSNKIQGIQRNSSKTRVRFDGASSSNTCCPFFLALNWFVVGHLQCSSGLSARSEKRKKTWKGFPGLCGLGVEEPEKSSRRTFCHSVFKGFLWLFGSPSPRAPKGHTNQYQFFFSRLWVEKLEI